ncbi:MFS transporter [Brevibacterium linens]|uniref:MFS transporter, DHA1 family, arabinose polymer transporter n=3 Tax=Brevibacterium TaxID=1696 RepID=A0A2H1K848_BRELN|nr:MFS transporter [Brevibacterium linens]KAB1948249.1 MFS transporter [Brevibacterium linens ATCC 9172]SMX76257.1 MFS transporter, DHA1 family, arabinose polymer transporter [Brevibacterium linens ATCC 9172]SMX95412.1 MFS transporter, DHA1 family, arabinose polymer transporter [Brevibacterium linens]
MSDAPVSRGVYKFAVFALAIGAFAIGVTEFATMGLLPMIAEELGITVPQAGHAVSFYAIGVVVGAPLITTIAAHMDRKLLLLCMMGLFALGNLASMLAPTATLFNIARFVSGLPHGAYLGIGAVVAASLVPANRRGRAMSRVMLGLTIANIFGVPFAAALGNMFGWRSAYALVAALGVLTVIMVAIAVPRVSVGAGEVPSARGEIKALGRVQIILTLVAGSVGFGGMFAVYTYITPTMTDVAGVPSVAIPWVLAVYGLGMTAGSLIAGPLVDKSIERSATGGMILSALVLAAFGAFTHIAAIAIIALFLIGISGSMITTALQMRLFRESHDAPSLSAAMNHAAFNLANALGAWLGGIVITAGLGYRAPAWVGVGLCVSGLIVISVAIFLRRGGSPDPSTRTSVET